MTTTTLVAPISLSNDLLTGAEWSPTHTRELLHLSADIKARPVRYASTLQGKFIALIFEKPSLRTRVTFDVGIQSMGGSVVFLDHTQASASLGARESIADVARNLDRWVQGIVARVYHQRAGSRISPSLRTRSRKNSQIHFGCSRAIRRHRAALCALSSEVKR